MSGKKTMFQRQHVSLSKKYNAAGSGALYMQTGTRKITRNDNKIRCWLQKLNLSGPVQYASHVLFMRSLS